MAKRYSPTAEEADRLAIQHPDWPWDECWERAKEIHGGRGDVTCVGRQGSTKNI